MEMGLMMTDRREREGVVGEHRGALFPCFLPSLDATWLFSWLYLSALGGSGGWVSFSSKPSRLLLDCREGSRVGSRVLQASRTGGGTADEIEKSMCWS